MKSTSKNTDLLHSLYFNLSQTLNFRIQTLQCMVTYIFCNIGSHNGANLTNFVFDIETEHWAPWICALYSFASSTFFLYKSRHICSMSSSIASLLESDSPTSSHITLHSTQKDWRNTMLVLFLRLSIEANSGVLTVKEQ